jgi:hypothetical protein
MQGHVGLNTEQTDWILHYLKDHYQYGVFGPGLSDTHSKCSDCGIGLGFLFSAGRECEFSLAY